MAHNPQVPHGQGPQGAHDPAGSTQMFRAFVDEDAPQGGSRRAAAAERSGPPVGLIAGVVIGLLVLGGVVWLALA
ncbi:MULTISPECIES: hypothetical protein [Streptomyces]|uniref:Uncharacterized protein n=1 Tax=Streptomyces tsukubensis (strain DSM 42081 / NBRC 108919 / NRRL 18488 / 9993) TaxID=1114943 RepID=A0A7G3UEJ8_STRT9|nr:MULTISPECIES: hypothetical protein [Streptomyces]AZK95097.1 hypothetical protein B7R87_15470 [Streptomyces tsukubensis]MYS64176.1 hypothetical protein [Streptomyces sp. SID5473]QKM68837.1 hypothetical protein STSU_018305 [Streptomyces tsukubensis NRRL18488]TAI43642.1 hypothetical protein EWI31_18060 [Streptomyces tsukubensis]